MNQEEFERGRIFHASDPRFPVQELLPSLVEDTDQQFWDTHYTLHTAWAARVVAEIKPERLVDFSSLMYFAVILSAFVPVDFYEFKTVKLSLPGFTPGSADMVKLPFADNSLKLMSSLHAMEHIGLGRYGDALDKEGDIKAAHELQRVLAPGGDLLMVVPCGRPRLMFNSHRIYSYEQLTGMFPELRVHEFALIPDGPAQLIRNASPSLVNKQGYGCGCWWFKK